MDAESTSSSPKRHRWFRDLKADLEGKLNISSKSRPQSSRTHSRTSSTESSRNSTYSDTGTKLSTWGKLRVTLNELEVSAELVPSLKSAISGLISVLGVFEAAAIARQDNEKLAIDLGITVEFLNQHLKAPILGLAMDKISSIAWIIEKETKSVRAWQKQEEAPGDDIIRHYRRVEQLLHRIQIEASMSSWVARNEQLAGACLGKLVPAKLASHDSELSTSTHRRTCTADTRKAILSDLNDWADNPERERVYWMDGMAGTGKTTIAYTLATKLEARGQLAASFFCTRTSPECRDANRIIPTIAFQLAQRSTPFQSALDRALREDPDIVSRNISIQFRRLLKEPLEAVKGKIGNNLVVVIDALDECDNDQTAAQILDVLVQSNFLLRVDQKRQSLDDIEQALVQKDIEVYLQAELRFMSPSPNTVNHLTTLANKLFTHAATTVRYIQMEAKNVDHNKLLGTMLAVDSESQTTQTQLDTVYTMILDAALEDQSLHPKERELMQRVLWTIACVREPIPVSTLGLLVGSRNETQVLMALEPFQSVIHASEHTGSISILHASFSDFMFTQYRSGRFFCDRSAHSQLLAQRCLEIMKGQLRFNICDLPSSFLPDDEVPNLELRIEKNISPSLSYACRYWPEHLKITATSDELCGLVEEIFSHRLLFWIEAWLKVGAAGRSLDLLKLASDAHKFTAKFAAHAICRSIPHIYISALPLCPPSSLVSVYYRQRVQGLIEVKGTAIVRLGQAALATWINQSPTECVAYSPDGVHVANGSCNGMICIRDVRDGKIVVGPFQAHDNGPGLSSLMFSPNGARLVSGSSDCMVRVWDARDGTLVVVFPHTRGIKSVAFSPDSSRIVFGSYDCTAQILDANDGTLIVGPLEGHNDTVTSARFSPDGTRIVSGSTDHTIRLWDANTGLLINSITAPSASSVRFSPDGTLIASSSWDHTIRVWDAHIGTLAAGPFDGRTSSVDSIGFSPDGAHIVSSSRDRSICIWNVSNNLLPNTPPRGHYWSIQALDISPDGALIATGASDRTIRVWSALNGTPVAGPFQHTESVYAVKFSPDSTRIASGCYDHTIRLWHAREGTLIVSPPCFKEHCSIITSLAFSPDGLRIASGSWDYTVRVWDASQGTLVVLAMGPSASGTHTGNQIVDPFGIQEQCLSSICFSSDGSLIVSTSNKTLHMWNARNGQPIAGPFRGHREDVKSVAFSPDNTLVASGSWDRTVRLWNAVGGTPFTPPFQAHTRLVHSVGYFPNGSSILSADDLTIRAWDVRREQRTYAGLEEPREVQDDGWILNSNSQLLFWVPAEIREYFPRLNNPFTIGPQGSVQIVMAVFLTEQLPCFSVCKSQLVLGAPNAIKNETRWCMGIRGAAKGDSGMSGRQFVSRSGWELEGNARGAGTIRTLAACRTNVVEERIVDAT
ncbi:Vegetative incompatibility protein HET-E-1 [Ceratobasidium theobromae]|uniref:Vegetative incompatibility protein HET-E-1 n=1 Tax=Ceratobasidium theobromae TaxID=1582974 RepID=A0A5N5QDB2_9AGAM|nr:Vegetative incompatibility protein HET-E-1 [Ceratobasidium theobromae]